MGVRTRVEPIERDVQLIIDEDLSPEAQSKALAQFAQSELREAQDRNRAVLGEIPPHETWVDGRQGAAIEDVRPGGIIIFEFDLVRELFEWLMDQVARHAPRLSGRFEQSFILLADGVEASATAPPPAAEYVIINTQPYARKIERGLSSQAPDGVMEAVAVLAGRRFGNIAKVRFGYRSLLLDYVPMHRPSKRRGRAAPTAAHRSAHDMAKQSRQPAIIITV